MEQFKLPLPSLQFLASHAVVRSLLLMKVDEAYWRSNDSLRKCELRIDKLALTPPTREYVKNVLRGFFEQVQVWVRFYRRNPDADIHVDAHGNIDERRMAQHDFKKRCKGDLYRADFQRFARFLEYLSWYHPYHCSDFVKINLDLQKVNASLVGPEYRLFHGELHVVFRFVNCCSIPPELDDLDKCQRNRLQIFSERNDILVTYSVYIKDVYNEDMFRIHVDLLPPLQRLNLVKEVLYDKIEACLVPGVFRLLNVLDPETRLNCLLGLRDRFHSAAYAFFRCCLIPGYESVFIPMMELVGLNLNSWKIFRLFCSIVDKINLTGFQDLPSQFWQLLPASKKSELCTLVLENCHFPFVKKPLKTLSQANTALFQVLFDDISAGLSKSRARDLLSVILNE